MSATTYDITIEKAATFTLSIIWKDSTGTLINLTGYTAHMQVRKSYTTSEIDLNLSTSNGAIVLGGSAGTIVVTATATLTLALTIKAGLYDLVLTSGGGVATRLLEGSVTISPEITQP